MIVIVFGLPGSGKSYFAERLAENLEADYASSDQIRKKLIAHPDYSDKEKQFIYKKLAGAMYDHINTVKPLVIDGTFYLQKNRNDFNRLARCLNADLYWIEVKADEKVIKERLSEKREYSDADFEVYLDIKKDYAPFTEGRCLSLISTNHNIEEMLDRALIFLNRLPV